MARVADDLELRAGGPHDTAEVLALLTASMGWVPDEAYAAFFEWKHRQSPFGESPSWVAVDGGHVVGFRTFTRWEFTAGDRVLRAVRAVDTATHPDHQGRGIFSRLTLRALEELREEGVDFVFNTPNEKSRPGYLKMGWSVVGRQPVHLRPRRLRSLPRIASSRTAAEKWSLPATTGVDPATAFADTDAVAALLAGQPRDERLRTRRTVEYLRRRYGFGLLAYRVALLGPSVDEGFAVYRLRRRGSSVEAAVCDVVAPGGDRRTVSRLLRNVARSVDADYSVVISASRYAGGGFVPLPGAGPLLTWKGVNAAVQPPADDWALSLGDVELF